MPASLAAQTRNAEAWPQLLMLVAEGHSLRTICQRPDMPSRSTVHRWARDDEAKAKQLERAVEMRLWTLGDQMIALADAGRFKEADAVMRYVGRLEGGSR